MSKIDWSELFQRGNAEEAYNFFHGRNSECHRTSFKLVRLSRKCAKDKAWITRGLKISSNHKNKLCKKWRYTHHPDDEKAYKTYLKIFKKSCAAAQSAFCKEQFDTKVKYY